jgi:hypothetical protein
MMMDCLSVLVETDVLSLLTEALTAQVEVVLSDKTGLVLADTAAARALAVVSGAGVPDAFVRHGVVVGGFPPHPINEKNRCQDY